MALRNSGIDNSNRGEKQIGALGRSRASFFTHGLNMAEKEGEAQ